MAEWRKTTLVVLAAVALAGTVRADMTQSSAAEDAGRDSQTCSQADPAQTSGGIEFPGHVVIPLANLGLPIQGLLDTAQAAEPPSARIVSDGQDSLHLCLYALLSLGLCKAAPWARKVSFGVAPHWYHDGGPFQIGHRFAISPDCVCHAPVYCFIQPVGTAEDLLPQYHRGIIAPLPGKPQFTPAVLGARGPPF